MKILVTTPFTEAQRNLIFEALPQNADVLFCPQEDVSDDMIAETEILLGNLPPQRLAAHGKKLRWVQLDSAGSDAYCAGVLPPNCVLTNATGSYGLAISEYLICMMLMLQKKMHLYGRNQIEKSWHREGQVRSAAGETVVCLGFGNIGSEFAQRAKALGMTVIAVKRRPSAKPDYVDALYTAEHLEEVLPQADVLVMCMPNTAETQHMLNAHTISLMRDHALVLNVGRGSAIEQAALIDALKSGKLGGAALDVTEREPLPADDPLWDAPNLILTPHITGGLNLPETLNRIARLFAANAAAWFSGAPLKNVVDFATGYRK